MTYWKDRALNSETGREQLSAELAEMKFQMTASEAVANSCAGAEIRLEECETNLTAANAEIGRLHEALMQAERHLESEFFTLETNATRAADIIRAALASSPVDENDHEAPKGTPN